MSLPSDVAEHLREETTAVCADGRKTWECHWCWMPTPVGWSWCRNHFECMRRLADQRDRALDLVEEMRWRG